MLEFLHLKVGGVYEKKCWILWFFQEHSISGQQHIFSKPWVFLPIEATEESSCSEAIGSELRRLQGHLLLHKLVSVQVRELTTMFESVKLCLLLLIDMKTLGWGWAVALIPTEATYLSYDL